MAVNNLTNEEARKKIKELAESIDFNLMATDLDTVPLHAIPMSTKKVDKEGNIWFLSGRDSKHNTNIEKDGRVHLFYCKPGGMEFLNVYGNAEILDNKKIIDELYDSSDDNWFDGKDDPNVSIISVVPKDVYYWDTKNNMLVSLLKMGVGAVTGKKTDPSEEGEIKV